MAGKPSREERTDAIRRAAIGVFAAQGFRGTSMADIAAAAGVSRSALYQYFDDRADLFRASLKAVLEDAADAALAALDEDRCVADRLEAYLNRAHADGYEALSSTAFGEELMAAARLDFAADVAETAFQRTREGLRAFVTALPSVDDDTRAQVIDLLLLSPKGLKSDHPSPETYRIRLQALAKAAAQLLAPTEQGTTHR